jgi:hypothetical protein
MFADAKLAVHEKARTNLKTIKKTNAGPKDDSEKQHVC